ncbi:MAG TPA: hypothetical protein VE076_13410 [Nitrososphaeraceae archaeon]|nr:hypothetical protein [Nitrososphaeraceae archaeon]
MTDTKTSKSTIITDCATEEKTIFKGVRIGFQQRLSSTTKIKKNEQNHGFRTYNRHELQYIRNETRSQSKNFHKRKDNYNKRVKQSNPNI